MKGRKALPIELHKLRGTFRKDRHGSAPQPKPGIAPPPAHLDDEAKREYRRVAKLLLAVRVLTQGDVAALASYSLEWSRKIEAETKLRETGLVVRSPAGFPCLSPYLSIANRAGVELRKWAAELGLTPASRSKVKGSVDAGSDADGDKSRFFKSA